MDDEVEVTLRTHEELRSEILQSIRYAFPIIVHGDGEDGVEEYRSFRTWERAYHGRMVGDDEN